MTVARFRDMESPEAAYVRQQNAAAAERSRQAAGKEDSAANHWQMTADVYGREGKDYSAPAVAADAARKVERHLNRRDQHLAAATRHEALAKQPEQSKK